MTIEVLLVRHAIAFERDRKRWPDDDLRPLSPEGIRRFRRAAAGLKRLIKPPQRVWTSPLKRAMQTADILRECAGWPRAVVKLALSPDDSPSTVMQILHRARESRLALIGHEPALSRFGAICLAGADTKVRLEVKKGGVLALTFAGAPQAGNATLQALVHPRYLRAARKS